MIFYILQKVIQAISNAVNTTPQLVTSQSNIDIDSSRVACKVTNLSISSD